MGDCTVHVTCKNALSIEMEEEEDKSLYGFKHCSTAAFAGFCP